MILANAEALAVVSASPDVCGNTNTSIVPIRLNLAYLIERLPQFLLAAGSSPDNITDYFSIVSDVLSG